MEHGILYRDNNIIKTVANFNSKKMQKTLQSITDQCTMNPPSFAVSLHHQIFGENVDRKF